MSKVLTIAFPSKGVTDPAFAAALRRLEIPEGFTELEILYAPSADVAVARNILSCNAHGDYIFFVDDDVIPPQDAITKLFKHGKDIVSGLYFARREPFYPQAFNKTKVKGKEQNDRYDALFDVPEGLVEIDACGFGCILIKAEVLDKMKTPFFKFTPGGEENLQKGEDYYFCEKAKKAGYKIYLDTSIVCKHIGTSYIGPDHWNVSKQRINDLKEKLGDEKFEEYKQKFWDKTTNQRIRNSTIIK